MSKLKIITVPNKLLYQKSEIVEKVDDSIRKLMLDMAETMKGIGIGLAAIQVGVLKRIIVIDVEHKGKTLFMINPEILSFSKSFSPYEERCLSVPNEQIKIFRPAKIMVQYLDFNGNEKKLKADGLLATCIQHEIDHLNGITILEREKMSPQI